MKDKLILGIVQNRVEPDKSRNIQRAREMIEEVARAGAKVVALPEMFNCPYDNSYFPEFAEQYPSGSTLSMLAETAAAEKVYLFGGSIPEKENGRIYNTCFIFGPDGTLLAKHRKTHLFDVELNEGITFKESAVLSPGDGVTVVDTEYGKIAALICYDIRFPEMARAATLKGAVLLLVPAAFNMVSGPAHWAITMRMRAIDNQFFVAAAAPARNTEASYVAYGHSMVVDPWGKVIHELDEKEGKILVEIDLSRLTQVREEFPLLKHRRTDLYEMKDLKSD